MLNLFGAAVLSFMTLMYALERRHRGFILAFAIGCGLSSLYGFLAGTWPFGVLELIWTGLALYRFLTSPAAEEKESEVEPRERKRGEREHSRFRSSERELDHERV
jgi:hypothetical protein